MAPYLRMWVGRVSQRASQCVDSLVAIVLTGNVHAGPLRRGARRGLIRPDLVRGVEVVTPAPEETLTERFSQREIYDRRYAGEGYDARSSVRVLRAERIALEAAVIRAAEESRVTDTELSIHDFGYGTGRVTNEFMLAYAEFLRASNYLKAKLPARLHVVAYDVSSQGLQKAVDQLVGEGFRFEDPVRFDSDEPHGYIAGELYRSDEVPLRITFVHGAEGDDAGSVRELVLRANGRRRFTLTTSWYSGLGHIPLRSARRDMLEALIDATVPSGEIVLAVASTGDLVDAQGEWARRIEAGTTDGLPLEVAGDVIYETELGQQNFWHVFDTDILETLAEILPVGRRRWVEAIRMPDEEFQSVEEERRNYDRAREFSERRAGQEWTKADFASCHTVAIFISGEREVMPVPGDEAARVKK